MSNCGCEPKTYNIGMGCCQPVLAPIENYYTKHQIDKMLEDIESGITSGCCITPEEVDEKIESAKTEIEAEIPSLSGYATEQWVEDKHYISGVDLSDYALKSEIPTVPTSNTAFTNDAGYITDDALSGYAESSAVTEEISAAVSGKVDTSSVVSSVTSASTDSEIPTAKAVYDATQGGGGGGTTYTAGRAINIDSGNTISLDLPISAGTSTNSIAEGYATSATSNSSHAEGNSTSATSLASHAEGYGTKATEAAAHAEGWQTIASGQYSHAEGERTKTIGENSHAEGFSTIAANKSEHASGQYNISRQATSTFGNSGNTLFSVGNGTSANDKHNAFEIRQNGDIYLTSGGTDIKLQDHLGGGGTEYSAGTNVQINNGVISATDTTYTAGDNITISNQNVISTVTKFWCGSEAQWALISGGTLDSNTIYMVY